MITRKLAPALATGCSMIIKPASQTPLSALALGELAIEAGLPKGLLNIITGDAKTIGDLLTTHPDIKKFSFTGSTQVEKILYAQCSANVKKISMELGGNAPFIIFNDSNIEKAVNGLISYKYRNTGQTCVSANRIYVQNDIYDKFAETLVIETKKLIVGNGIEKNVNIGPLIDKNALEKIKTIVDNAKSLGAKIILGGKQHEIGGLFYEPTILLNVNHNMMVTKEEIFGPIAALIKFDTEEEVIDYANNTEYGLASYCYTNDLKRVFKIIKNLEFGMVGINSGIISNAAAPFGGIKNSGIGREGSHYGLNDYLETKYILLNEI